MNGLNLMGWSKDNEYLKQKRNSWKVKLFERVLKLFDWGELAVFHLYTKDRDHSNSLSVVLSEGPVDYWSNNPETSPNEARVLWHDDDGPLGVFSWWKDARRAARALERTYDDYRWEENDDFYDGDSDDDVNLYIRIMGNRHNFDFDEWEEI